MQKYPPRSAAFRPRPIGLAALLFSVIPSLSYADVGSLGGVVVFFATAAGAIWIVLTLLAFLLFFRRFALLKRLGLTVLFFFLPALLLGGELLKEYAFGEGYAQKTEVTTKPLAVLGVTFPPGSHVEYEQTGGFFGWGADRTLQNISSPHPVMLGHVPITGLLFVQNNCCNQVRAQVSEGVTVNGWPCGDTTFDLTPSGPVLHACFLTTPHTWKGDTYLDGAFVDFSILMRSPGTQ